jgi:hypothetical protein
MRSNLFQRRSIILVAVGILYLPYSRCWGAGFSISNSIEQNTARSSVVAVGRLTQYVEDPTQREEFSRRLARSGGNFTGGFSPFKTRFRGTYTITVLKKLKGECADTVQVYCNAIDSMSFGDPNLQIPESSLYLLFLSRDADGRWIPTDAALPLIPLSDGSLLPNPNAAASPVEGVVQLLLGCLRDPRVRVSAVYILRTVRSDAVVEAVRPLVDDSDIEMAQNALCCMARNQVVEMIPRIADVERRVQASGRGSSRAVTELGCYTTADAVPYLNALLFDTGSEFTRINAASTLNENGLANESSIPYLIMGLKDPEPQGEVAYISHRLLHRFVPALGPPKDRSTFLKSDRQTEIRAVEAWWSGKLAGGRRVERRP